MGRRFAELAFTPLVKEQQRQHGSRHSTSGSSSRRDAGDRLGPDEQQFIRERDGFYMASVSETGWPYVQYRGGEKGFLRVLDAQTLGFADLRGNRQYISVGKSAARRPRDAVPDGLPDAEPVEDPGPRAESTKEMRKRGN